MQKDNRQAQLKQRLTFVKEDTGLGRDYHHGLLLVRNLYVQSDLCVYYQSLGW